MRTDKTSDLTQKLTGDKAAVADPVGGNPVIVINANDVIPVAKPVLTQPESTHTDGSTENPMTATVVEGAIREFNLPNNHRNADLNNDPSLCSEIIGQTIPLTCDDLQNLSSGNISECLLYFFRNCCALTLCAPASACILSGIFIEANICKGESNGNIGTIYLALKAAECLMETGGRFFCISGAAAFATPAPETSCQKLGSFFGTLFGIPACAITLNYSIPPAIALANTIAQ
ncbi:MAG: hypothetical protein CMF55_02190 [Legionellales bacterium]|nr:hypothetical protein [Legionellales bacterium]